MKKHRILLAEDHPLYRKGLVAALSELAPDWEFFEAGDGKQVINAIKEQQIDLVILDVRIPGLNGIDIVQILRRDFRNVRIIVLSQYDDNALISYMLSCGVDAYLLKTTALNEMIRAIQSVLDSLEYENDLMKTARRLIREDHLPAFSAREKDVIQYLALGKSTKDIARDLKISEFTVNSYRKELLRKTKAKNVAELVSYGYRNALLE